MKVSVIKITKQCDFLEFGFKVTFTNIGAKCWNLVFFSCFGSLRGKLKA